MMMQSLLRNLLSAVLFACATVTAVAVLHGCSRTESYPQALVEADSACVAGYYGRADSLLEGFDARGDKMPELTRMYRQLVGLTRKYVDEGLTEADFSMVDSLCRYYHEAGLSQKEARALLMLGSTYALVDDNPSAIDCCLKAESIARRHADRLMESWACQDMGDIYFNQRMLDECKSYYRRYADISLQRHDTLRVAIAMQRMGRVYTIENNIDSVLACYQQCIGLSEHIGRSDIVSVGVTNLCDIYIQIGEYDKASQIMPHDQLNDENWAFWHYGQNHVDSAVYYFKSMLGKYGLFAQTQNLKILAQLEAQRGNLLQSIDYYNQLIDAEDSLREESQTVETRKAHAQYNYTAISNERNALLRDKRRLMIMLVAFSILVAVGVIATTRFLKKLKETRAMEVRRERLLRMEKENILQASEKQLAENRLQLKKLEEALENAQQYNDVLKARQLKSEAELLTLKNKQIENRHRQIELKLEKFKESPLYRKLLTANGNTKTFLTNEDWMELAQNVDDMFDHFTSRLTSLGKLSNSDLQICYLLKIGLSPADISVLMHRSKSAITLARQRMWHKLTGEDGTAAQLDKYIASF